MHQSTSELELWYPRILEVVSILWGTVELDSYLNEILMLESHEYGREGFPYVVMSELMLLHYVNSELLNKQETDIWMNRK